ncbi:MAG: endo alpha-1,4 polygalactosaminidase [Bacteroidia bacterium]|nr:endo alpha-1,4 polygalactosaminidase [Bacteroidia bacterium]
MKISNTTRLIITGVFIAILIFNFIACSKNKRSENAGLKMQDFVIQISKYARAKKPNFIIIPQNGAELAFQNINPEMSTLPTFMDAIDGFGIEELHYNGNLIDDDGRLKMLQKIKETKNVLVSEYITDKKNLSDAFYRNYNQNFICFTRLDDNYHYSQIPDTVPLENSLNISTLHDAKNYLYLINSELYSNKSDFLKAISATNFDVIIMDLFFDDEAFSNVEIEQLKTKANGGKRLVISYINIGSAEKFRYYWKKGWGLHHPLWIKRKYEGYDDEYWVKFWKKEWQDIIYGNDESYMSKIITAGFDGAYLDNIEAYYFLYFKND